MPPRFPGSRVGCSFPNDNDQFYACTDPVMLDSQICVFPILFFFLGKKKGRVVLFVIVYNYTTLYLSISIPSVCLTAQGTDPVTWLREFMPAPLSCRLSL